ncbi:MAG: glycosyltransferase [Limisphaerales bacterium]
MNFLNAIFAALAALSLALALWQWFAARKFALHKRIADSNFSPDISILKPLKGCDATTAESLQSWFNQDYSGQTQILFGVTDINDPVCKIVEELLKKNPNCNGHLFICGDSIGANAKVSTLVQLERLAKHELILISDADVRVSRDFLANFVAPLRDPKIALVNCFYRLANPTTAAMQWEAVAVNADFWSQVLQSQSLKPLDFALGAAVLLRRAALAQIGGFAPLTNCLADDYQLGNRIAQKNYRIALCPVVVDCWNAPMNWCDVWKHQLRWARTIRVCQPFAYSFSILSNATFWPLLWLVVSLVSKKTFCAPLAALVFLLIRIAIAQNLQRRFTPERKLISPFWLAPVKDLLQTMIWLCAFAGNTIVWRGREMKLRRDGTLREK